MDLESKYRDTAAELRRLAGILWDQIEETTRYPAEGQSKIIKAAHQLEAEAAALEQIQASINLANSLTKAETK